MWRQLSPGLRINIFLTLLVGLAYPLAMTAICQLAFPHQANGSLITAGGRVLGSELIGQNFTRPEYFHPRPSAAGNDGYDATSSGGSNYGPTNQKLIDRVKAAVAKFRKSRLPWANPFRPADRLGQRPRPGHQSRRRYGAGGAGREGPRRSGGPHRRARHPLYGRAGSRVARRSSRQRAGVEPGTGPRVSEEIVPNLRAAGSKTCGRPSSFVFVACRAADDKKVIVCPTKRN
jgi:hypothetical protein